MKLELKHLAPYLPYSLKVNRYDAYEFFNPLDLMGFSYGKAEICNEGILSKDIALDKIKPILRPLSDLTKEIEHKGRRFIPEAEIENLFGSFELNHNPELLHFKLDSWTTWSDLHSVTSKLFEWHFDVFNLIPNNLAININDL
ncbi:hypothetical protein [Joostella sp. CR20]|uniref:hypothetical protein n=1 Tax=Joostella sp. CR20 TaxID=2804312 RepID=UPI00313BB079